MAGAHPVAGIPCKEADDALKLAALSFLCLGFAFGPLAISKAAAAKRKIAADPSLSGTGKANAAILLGIAAMALWLIGLIRRGARAGR